MSQYETWNFPLLAAGTHSDVATSFEVRLFPKARFGLGFKLDQQAAIVQDKMDIKKTKIPEVVVLEPKVFGDERGFFLESYNQKRFEEIGLGRNFVQDNHSRSARNVLRGLHYQLGQPQGKLVRVVAGAIWDVAVDIRRSSPTFGQWAAEELSAENKTDALGSRRICSWLRRDLRLGGRALQGHRFLRAFL